MTQVSISTFPERLREAMAHAPVGDDVFGDDPTIHELESRAAEMPSSGGEAQISPAAIPVSC